MPLNLDPSKQMERASYLQFKACLPSLIQVCLLSLKNKILSFGYWLYAETAFLLPIFDIMYVNVVKL